MKETIIHLIPYFTLVIIGIGAASLAAKQTFVSKPLLAIGTCVSFQWEIEAQKKLESWEEKEPITVYKIINKGEHKFRLERLNNILLPEFNYRDLEFTRLHLVVVSECLNTSGH